MTRQPTVVLEKLSFLEGPRFRDGRLWMSDFYTHRVLSCRPDGSDLREEVAVPGQPSGLGWLPDGRLLVVSMRDQQVLRREPDGTLVTHADLAGVARGWCNDMVVDAAGRAYVGCFGFDLMTGAPVAAAPLIRVDPDGTVTVAAEDLLFPNGSAVIGDVLVVAETFGNRISAFDLAADGSLGPRRNWARFGDVPTSTDVGATLGSVALAPDGICADVEGAVWAADPRHGRAVRVREGGKIVDQVEASTNVYACVLGGDDGRTLFLCTAPSFAEHERRDTRDAALLAVQVDVPVS
jgi:sugar lactone lactonase YvrE